MLRFFACKPMDWQPDRGSRRRRGLTRRRGRRPLFEGLETRITPSIASTTTISPLFQTSTYGSSVSFTAQVTGQSGEPTPTGTVTFYDGAPNSGGTVVTTAPVDDQGDALGMTSALHVNGSPHNIYAVYDPDSSSLYASSTSTQPASLTVTPATLTAALTGTVEKTYDGTTSATLTVGNYQLSGIIGNDVVTLNDPAAGTYDTKNVGTGKRLNVAGLAISGTDAGNYQLASTTISGFVGAIDAKPLTVTDLTAGNKVYDGTTAATLDAGSVVLPGVVLGDVVILFTNRATASFADKNVGTAKPVTVSGLLLTGRDAHDYALTQPTGLTANITPATITVFDLNANTKVYDGTTAATLNLGSALVNGVLGNDQVSLSPTGYTATFSTKDVGAPLVVAVSGLSLTGAGAGNYTLAPLGVVVGAITPAPLTITAHSVTKVYGAPLPAFTVSYSGFVPGDSTASLTTLPTVTTSATAASPVGNYTLNVGGAGAVDYTITYVPGALVIAKASTAASLSSSVSTAVVGQTDTFTVQVTPVGPGAGNPAGQVTFLVDGAAVGTPQVDPTTGRVTLSTTAIGRGTHTITASYSGDPNFQAVGTQSNQVVVTAASTQPALSAQALRNKRGKIVSVNLTTQVLVVSPGRGVPTGSVTFFRKGHRLGTTVLKNGIAILNLKRNQALRKSFTVQYGGDADFHGSASASLLVTKKSLTMTAGR